MFLLSNLIYSQESVCAVAFNTTGEYFATADMNGVIRVWRSKNCSLVVELTGPEEVEWLKFHSKVYIPHNQ